MVANNEKRLELTRVINLHVEVDRRERKWKFFLAEILDDLPNLKANKRSKRSVGPFPERESKFIKYLSGNLARFPPRWNRYWKVLLSGKVERASLICALSTYGSERN